MTRSITPFNIPVCQKKYAATFVGDFPTKLKNGGWGPPGAVFYQADPDVEKGHKHLYGLFWSKETPGIIYDASYLDGIKFTGAVLDDGSYVWSRHTHDYREVPGGAIDGGFDYTRVIGNPKLVTLQIKDGKVVEVND